MKNNHGFALVLTLFILTMLSVMVIGFLSFIRIDKKITLNHYYHLLADYAAESGIEQSVAKLKAQALNRAYYTKTDPVSNNYGLDARRRFDITYNADIIDCASRIYLNDNNPKLKEIFKELPGISETKAGNIINNQPYLTKQELMKVSGIGTGTYASIKDYLTVYSWVNKHIKDTSGNTYSAGRAPLNLNSSISQNPGDRTALKAVLKPLGFPANDNDLNEFITQYLTSSNIVVCSTCNDTGKSIDTNHHPTWFNTALDNSCPGICGSDGKIGYPYKSWREFEAVVAEAANNVASVAALANNIKNNANPNRTKPAAYTTEFCFNSNGYFNITSTGTTKKPNGTILASSTINTVYHIFDIAHFTLNSQFEANGWEQFKVNTRDSCPVSCPGDPADWRSDLLTVKIKDSVKLGFWDDFNDVSFSAPLYNVRTGEGAISNGEYLQSTNSKWPKFDLCGHWNTYTFVHPAYIYINTSEAEKWKWEEFYLYIWIYDLLNPWQNYPDKLPVYNWPADGEGYPNYNPDYLNSRKNPHPKGGNINPWDVSIIFFGLPPNKVEENEIGGHCGQLSMLYQNKPENNPAGSFDFYLHPKIQLKFPSLSGDSYLQYLEDLNPALNIQYPYLETRTEVAGSMSRIEHSQGKIFRFDVCRTRRNGISKVIRLGLRIDPEGRFCSDGTWNGWNYAELPNTGSLPYDSYHPGLISFLGSLNAAKVDNLRIIPRTPYFWEGTAPPGTLNELKYAYLSSAFIPENMTDTQAQNTIANWGTLTGTVTVPSTASDNSEFVFFQTNKDNFANNLSCTKGRIAGSQNIARLQFKACFESNHVSYKNELINGMDYSLLSGSLDNYSNDFNFSETPVLEDITVTYLPRTEVMYYKKEE